MDVCSPKNGFVTEVFVSNGQHVEVGAPLLQMDTDAEDRALERLRITEQARQIRSAKYQGEELELMRTIASLTVASAQASSDESSKLGLGVKALSTAAALNKNAYEKTLQHKKELEYSINRYLKIDRLGEEANRGYSEYLAKRKSRMKLLAPVAGKVRLMVGQNSFAAVGTILLKLDAE
jgi:pyruvate/2-oxoglutarate dehydrogenase complex dihydrolipoamide acyltransferase (E2) component